LKPISIETLGISAQKRETKRLKISN